MIWPMVTGVGAVAYRLRLTPSTRLPSWFLLPSEWVNGPDVVEPNCGPDLLKHLARLEGFEPPAFWSVGRDIGISSRSLCVLVRPLYHAYVSGRVWLFYARGCLRLQDEH